MFVKPRFEKVDEYYQDYFTWQLFLVISNSNLAYVLTESIIRSLLSKDEEMAL